MKSTKNIEMTHEYSGNQSKKEGDVIKIVVNITDVMVI
jgi:hypothetical protein